jgi:ligand-binding SRPBCC domain-containing protein
MPTITLSIKIKSDIETVFDLSRSIDLHQISTSKTNERAIAGTTSGLINLGETVTWQATHFGIRQKLTSKITAYNRPSHFRDEQQRGAFKYIIHDHYFEQQGDVVLMTDIFEFQSPFGVLGWLFDKLVLTRYMTGFLVERNDVIRDYAERGRGEIFLNKQRIGLTRREQ